MWRYFKILQFSVFYLLASHVQASDNIKDIQEEEGRVPPISTSSYHAQLPPLVSDYDDQRPSTSGSSNVGAEDQGPFISTTPQIPIKKFKHFDYDPNMKTFSGFFLLKQVTFLCS